MYKSPIEIVSSIEKQIVQQQEENVIQAIHKMGVNVDKDELLKALAYDRDQYNKGYADGAKEFAEKCKACFPSIAGAFDCFVKEMVGEDMRKEDEGK